ncbi:MAG: hypothetical protein KAH18_13500 [Psychromonas sp.]|nr:hypothetical protein [Psychromonas sp.]
MLDDNQFKIIDLRRIAAKNTLRFFKDIMTIKGTTGCNPFNKATREEGCILNDYRDQYNPNTIERTMYYSISEGLGNCSEMAAICYCSLTSNPLIKDNSVVSLARIYNGDHSFNIITDTPLSPHGLMHVRDLGKTALIVDGWMQDWYFPNLGNFTSLTHHLLNIPNPKQFVIRKRFNFCSIYKSSKKLRSKHVPINR